MESTEPLMKRGRIPPVGTGGLGGRAIAGAIAGRRGR